MRSPLIVVTDSVFPNLDAARRVLSAVQARVSVVGRPVPQEIVKLARAADAVLVTYAKLTADMIEQMTQCRIISRFGIGVDNVDIAAATRSGIVVTKVPDYCIDEVSDHTMALLLALVRKIPLANYRVHAGRWEMSAVVPIHRLRGTILGLVGFGRIPQLLAPKAQAFGLRVMAYDPYITQDTMQRLDVQSVSFDELLERSDYVSVHTPLIPETQNLFRADVFRRMKKGAYLINTARGPLVDDSALADALDAGQLAGAALDVLSQEPPMPDSRLIGRENVILTPHTGFYSEESLIDLQVRASDEIVRVLSGQAPANPVNPEALAIRQTNVGVLEGHDG